MSPRSKQLDALDFSADYDTLSHSRQKIFTRADRRLNRVSSHVNIGFEKSGVPQSREGQSGARGDERRRHVDGDDARGDGVDGELLDDASGGVRATRRRSERISRGCPSRPSRSRGRGTREAGAPTARLRRDVRARRRGRCRRLEWRQRAATTQDLQRERRCAPVRGARADASFERSPGWSVSFSCIPRRARATRRRATGGEALPRARDRCARLVIGAGRCDARRARVPPRPETRITTHHPPTLGFVRASRENVRNWRTNATRPRSFLFRADAPLLRVAHLSGSSFPEKYRNSVRASEPLRLEVFHPR